MGVGGQHHVQAALPPVKKPGTIVKEAAWAPGPVWTGVENLAPTGIRSPDRPSRSQSLYRLSYPGPRCIPYNIQYIQYPNVCRRRWPKRRYGWHAKRDQIWDAVKGKQTVLTNKQGFDVTLHTASWNPMKNVRAYGEKYIIRKHT
jgi:hypothetical protein